MIGNIILPYKAPAPPIDPFNPETHIATEEGFIQLLEAGIYDEKYIGYKVQLSQTSGYNNGVWVIADVNHDSTTTNQTDCYDLISQDLITNMVFSNSSSNDWRGPSCSPRTWLNNTFYNGFSNSFKLHIMKPKYLSRSGLYDDDYIIIPSKVEVNGGLVSTDGEGKSYPIFTGTAGTVSNSSRIKNNSNWWTRSRHTDYSARNWYVSTNGSMYDANVSSSYGIVAIIRVQ